MRSTPLTSGHARSAVPCEHAAAGSGGVPVVGVAVHVTTCDVSDRLGELAPFALDRLFPFYGRVVGRRMLFRQAPGESSEFTHLHTSRCCPVRAGQLCC